MSTDCRKTWREETFNYCVCTARLTLVVSAEASSVVDNNQFGLDIGRGVIGLDIFVNKARWNLSASSPRRSEQRRNDLVEFTLAQLLHFIIRTL